MHVVHLLYSRSLIDTAMFIIDSYAGAINGGMGNHVENLTDPELEVFGKVC